jgi:hypothetical protein
MTTQATLVWQTTAALVAALTSAVVSAGTVSGRLAFPGRTPPAATVYVRALDGLGLHKQALKRGETEFSVEVPAGRYWVFARPDEPGLSELYGAYTQFSLCNRAAGTEPAPECSDHSLAMIEVPAGTGGVRAEIDDWMLSDETAAELDNLLGASPSADGAELGRPRFSEYRVALTAEPASALDLATEPRAAPYATQLAEAALAGSNFAGRFTLLRVACGEQCVRVAILDRKTGAIALPEALAHGLGTLPCRADRDLDFREDSRLLEFTRREADFAVTEYLLWDTEHHRLAPLAQYRSSLERFCSAAAASQ